MSIHRVGLAVIVVAILAAPSPALAWDGKGHMMVAFIAYQQLTPDVKDRVDQLLMLNPLHDHWLTLIPDGTLEAEKRLRVFMLAATWADAIKRDPSYSDDGTDNGNRPSGPTSSQNIGYTDKLRHKYWHFVDLPF